MFLLNMDREFLEARITATKAAIIALETAIDTLAAGAQSFTLDTGQTREVVTKAQLGELNRTLDATYNRLAVLEQRLNGGSTGIARPQ